MYPELHVGWHVDPLARTSVQSPTAPFVGAVDASQDKLNTRTWPASNAPVPSFLGAPIATRVPSEDMDTEYPKRSFTPAWPSMSFATWVHVPSLSVYTRTELLLQPPQHGLPIAMRVPSEDIDTEFRV